MESGGQCRVVLGRGGGQCHSRGWVINKSSFAGGGLSPGGRGCKQSSPWPGLWALSGIHYLGSLGAVVLN